MGNGHGHRILLVEDERDLAELLAEVLRDQGHEVLLAGSLAEARAAAEPGTCVVVADLTLPDASGESAARELGLLAGGAPLLLMSAVGASDLAELGVIAGAAGVIAKPFELDELERALDRACTAGFGDQPGA